MADVQPASNGYGQSQRGFGLEDSIGFQIRHTHRLMQRYLQMQIEPHGIALGTWYFLRVLWVKDGLTQRELSQAVGTMEPTTLVAIKAMMANGLVERRRNARDGRKINIYLTKKGKALEETWQPKAMEVNALATQGISDEEEHMLLDLLGRIQANLSRHIAVETDGPGEASSRQTGQGGAAFSG